MQGSRGACSAAAPWGMFAKVRPDTYNEWLRRVRSGRCDFGLSNVLLCRLWSGFRLWVWPDTHALEMAIPTSVYVSMVNLWKLPVWQSPQDNINFFLELDASWILRAMHVRGALL